MDNSLAVFSHPNHEVVAFGLLGRLKPRIIYLTDGGGGRRITETRAGLARLGLLGRAVFLDHTEASFYEALLRKDAAFFRRVADEVREAAGGIPRQAFCDAVEFYNPVHDMSLPVVLAAFGRSRAHDDLAAILKGENPGPGFSAFEIPLVYEDEVGQVVINRAVPTRRNVEISLQLLPFEITTKATAWEDVYTVLTETFSSVVGDPRMHQVEHLVPAGDPARFPGDGVAVRYDKRGAALRQRGEVAEVITRAVHYLPTVKALLTA